MVKKIISSAVFGLCVFGLSGLASASLVTSEADLGVRGKEEVTININGLGAHTQLLVNFDLFIYDSWDGSSGPNSPDYFGISVDDNNLFWSFDNYSLSAGETNTDIADETGNLNSIDWFGPIDRRFDNYNGGFVFDHSCANATIVFRGFGEGFQIGSDGSWRDESWQVKNLTVATNCPLSSVPEPTTLLLLGSGLLGLIGFSRKKR